MHTEQNGLLFDYPITKIVNQKINNMKKITAILMASILLTTQACNNSGGEKDSVDAANEMNAKKDTTNMSESKKDTVANAMSVNDDVAKFAVKAADGDMMEA